MLSRQSPSADDAWCMPAASFAEARRTFSCCESCSARCAACSCLFRSCGRGVAFAMCVRVLRESNVRANGVAQQHAGNTQRASPLFPSHPPPPTQIDVV
eukprot:349877-Chlamydomonas_euryale.AAC.3